MKVVVTGGAGFIGANVCRALAEAGVSDVVALDDLSTGAEANLRDVDGVELVVGSILEEEPLRASLAGATSVVHLAARPSVPRSVADPVASHEVNATGTVRVLEAARSARVGHVVFASSSSVYGDTPTLPKAETMAPNPRSPYAASKLAAESYVLAWARTWGMAALAFRFFNVFGPLQPAGHAYAAVVPAFVDAALAGRPLPIHGDGRQTRDFTYVGTVASVITDAVLRRVSHDGPVNLAFGTRSELLEVVALLEVVLGRPLERSHLESRVGDVRDSQADQSTLRALFADVRAVELEEGLRRTVEWMARERGAALADSPPRT